MRVSWLVSGAALSFLIVSGCSSRDVETKTNLASQAQAIQGGTTDSTHTFAVGLCGGQKGSCSGICSGALIAPNVVVTARHCVDNSPELIKCEDSPTFGARKYGPGASPLWVSTNTTMLSGSTTTGWHSVKKIVTPTDNHICGHDIALLVLNDLVPSSEATPIAPGVQYPMNDVKYSQRFVAIGYGNTAPADFATDAGTRRIRKNIRVLCIPGDDYIDCPPEAKVDPSEFVGGSGTCSGDSGSSAYEANTFETAKSISFGVLSRGGTSDDGTTCEGSVYTRLDKYRDLVLAAVEDASAKWTLYPKPTPDWTVYVAPPVVDAGTDAPKEAAPPPKLGPGYGCADDAECQSNICADPGDGAKFCSAQCTESTECEEGYVCKDSLCMPASTAAPKAANTTTTSGCSVAVDPQPTPWRWGALAGVAVALAAAGRRRRR